MKRNPVKIGIIGGGLMGREVASAFARWRALTDVTVEPQLVGVADLNPAALAWFDDGQTFLTDDYRRLLDRAEVEVIYVAVPHNLHAKVYGEVLEAGKDLLAEKPFGIDLAAAEQIAATAHATRRFVRCSSEFPFLPGAQRAIRAARSGQLGRVLEVTSGYHHSSDLDPAKAANWKRQSATCGEIGVLGDLGMHTCHVPLRLGWRPTRLFAQLQKGYPERPDGKGGKARCDTWDNALLHTWIRIGNDEVPMRLEMKRMAPGATNTWFLEVLGTDGGVRFSTAEPKTLWLFERAKEQSWKRTELGFEVPFKTVTGGIFEVGFPDLIQQMWAAFLMERAGELGERFGCATPAEAVQSQRIFAAALASQKTGEPVSLSWEEDR
ncbi:MAG: Gfo/Idh/MocA family oxidoreductase [Verrucomicrobia bacterium]|nr:Gfo/Idh/MocA family oxidoreductase [Verrucomicrobiota bacterium]